MAAILNNNNCMNLLTFQQWRLVFLLLGFYCSGFLFHEGVLQNFIRGFLKFDGGVRKSSHRGFPGGSGVGWALNPHFDSKYYLRGLPKALRDHKPQ